jgi:hypothetical protein
MDVKPMMIVMMDVRRVSSKIMAVRVRIGKSVLNLVSVYALHQLSNAHHAMRGFIRDAVASPES